MALILSGAAVIPSVVTVSYTHLDVYKRQTWHCCHHHHLHGQYRRLAPVSCAEFSFLRACCSTFLCVLSLPVFELSLFLLVYFIGSWLFLCHFTSYNVGASAHFRYSLLKIILLKSIILFSSYLLRILPCLSTKVLVFFIISYHIVLHAHRSLSNSEFF